MQGDKRIFHSALIAILIACCYLELGYLFNEQPLTTLTRNKFYPVFQTDSFRKAIEKLDAEKQVIAHGKTEDGLYIFIDFYINAKISEGYVVQKRDVTQSVGLSFKSWNLLSYGYNLIVNKLLSKGDQRVLWIVDVRRPFSIGELNKIESFSQDWPQDKLVLIKSDHEKQSIVNTPTVEIPRISKSKLLKILSDHGVQKGLRYSILSYYNANMEIIDWAMNQFALQRSVLNFVNAQSEKIKKFLEMGAQYEEILQKLCKKGWIQSKDIPEAIDPAQILGYDKEKYYWSSRKYLYAYQIVLNKICKEKDNIYVDV